MNRKATGNIADLDYDVRVEVNRRIRDGWHDGEVATWLKEAGHNLWKSVKKPEAAGAAAVRRWRRAKSGYVKWEKENGSADADLQFVQMIEKGFSKVAGPGAKDYLQGAGRVHLSLLLARMNKLRQSEKEDPEAFAEIHAMLTDFYDGAREQARLEQKEKQLTQKDREIALDMEKFQFDAAKAVQAKFEELRKIDTGSGSSDEKIEQIGKLIFGEDWK